MTSGFHFPLKDVSFSAFAMSEVLNQPLANETASSRLKQISLLICVQQMQAAGIETTTSEIQAVTGLDRKSVVDFSTPLIQRGLLAEKPILNRSGRGRAKLLYIPDTILKSRFRNYLLP